MKISGRRDYLVNLESIAMTDIVLNMFIFFFISFSLLYTFNADRLKKLAVNLPKAKNTNPIQSAQRVNISVTGNGVTYLESEALTVDELEEEIGKLKTANNDLNVLLHADRVAQFRYIAKVLDILNGLDVKNINIAVTPESQDK
ncbi:MAG: biopolymer transporter ExbD [Candidatus Omnitrophica bacterium]|nr:biopolymer transporter ExbD [Candidatus Omnitrophota bacterium]